MNKISKCKISVLLTCHNRMGKTLKCLEALYQCDLLDEYSCNVVLVDDGSTDNTEEAVRKLYPSIEILKGDGGLFWNRGMLKGWEHAQTQKTGFVLWLNDDTTINPDAISKMLNTHEDLMRNTGRSGIVVGATLGASGRLSYGGIARPSMWKPTKFERLELSDAPRPCITMNGNCVLVSREVFQAIGLLDGRFQHGMGDFDYGLRATKAGFPIWVAPGTVGHCENDNAPAGSYKDCSLPLANRWKKILGPKGLPPRDWRVFCQRHAGPVWPLYWVWPYVRVLFSALPRLRF